LTIDDVPVIIDSCVNFIAEHGQPHYCYLVMIKTFIVYKNMYVSPNENSNV